MIDFTNIDYLKSGNDRQQRAYRVLCDLGILKKLSVHKPILVGTIPIEIDLPDSDLDIICQCHHHAEFAALLQDLFGVEEGFVVKTNEWNDVESTVAHFVYQGFEIEVFGQNIPTKQQNAYRHMVIEHKLLLELGHEFRAKIKQLKAQGLKTEPAFAQQLGLKEDPYVELLNYDI